MLKNIHPLLNNGLLATLEQLRPGQTILLSNEPLPNDALRSDAHDGGSSIQKVLDAMLSVLPLAAPDDLPLQGWLADPADEAAYDVAFTVQGMSADAENRPLRMVLIDDESAQAERTRASAAVHIPAGGSAWAFFLRVGE